MLAPPFLVKPKAYARTLFPEMAAVNKRRLIGFGAPSLVRLEKRTAHAPTLLGAMAVRFLAFCEFDTGPP
jgi:hypothetical protein